MIDDHRIASLEVATIRTQYPRTVGRNARLGSHGSGFESRMVVIRTDQGAQGLGLAAGPIESGLIGAPVAEIFDPARGVTDPRAIGLDFALHDLAARVAGVPLHELLGGKGSAATDCYSGAIYFDDLDPQDQPRGIAAVLENCAADHAAGFRDFKLKIGRGNKWMEAEEGLRRDIEVTRAVREAYPQARILVDVNDGYSAQRAVEFLREVHDCQIFWIEEPFAETVADLQVLRDYLRESGSQTLIADGEFDPVEADVLRLAGDGLLDVLLMDVVSYGLTAWRRVMPELAQRGIHASPHAWGMPLKTRYAAQMAAGLGNVLIVEGVPGTTHGIDDSGYTWSDGVMTVPSVVGSGIDLTVPTEPLSL